MRGIRKSQTHSFNQISWKDVLHATPDGKWVTSAAYLAGHRQNPRWHKEVSLHPGPRCFCKTIQGCLKEHMCLLLLLPLFFHPMEGQFLGEISWCCVLSGEKDHPALLFCLWMDFWMKASISSCIGALMFYEMLFTDISSKLSLFCDLNMFHA